MFESPDYISPNFAFKKGYGLIDINDRQVSLSLSETRDLTNPIELGYIKGTFDFRNFVDWLHTPYNTKLDEYLVIVSYDGDTRYVKLFKVSRKGKTLFSHNLEITNADAEALIMLLLGLDEY